MLINDHNPFVYSVELARGQAPQMVWWDPSHTVRSVALTRRGLPLVIQSAVGGRLSRPAGLQLFDDRWTPTSSVSFASLNTTATSWNLNRVLIDTDDYTHIMGYNATGSDTVTILDHEGVQRDSWLLGT